MGDTVNDNPLLLTDFYKTAHERIYPQYTQEMTYYWTARNARDGVTKEVVFFGLQGLIQKYLIDYYQTFFDNSDKCIKEFEDIMKTAMPYGNDTGKFKRLAELGYLPLRIKALPEGTLVPIGCPMIEVENTHPDFAWLPGYIETLISSNLWFPITSATTAKKYYDILLNAYANCDDNVYNVPYAVSDFSMRGHTSTDSAEVNGVAHLLYFNKTANISSLAYAKKYYFAQNNEFQNAGTPSSEHSVMSAYGGPDKELEAFKSIIDNTPDGGKISIVSDTYDLWNAILNIYPLLISELQKRDITLICRPDSGSPVKIICGDEDMGKNGLGYTTTLTPRGQCIHDGVVESLWKLFGGITNDDGYKILDRHIRVIYGDAITHDRCREICDRLIKKRFAISNVTFGVGSYSYQYTTRDVFSQAYKSTHAVVNREERLLYKAPATDTDSMKKSQKGLCVVYKDSNTGELKYKDNLLRKEYEVTPNLLQTVFLNGKAMNTQTLSDIRKRCRYGI